MNDSWTTLGYKDGKRGVADLNIVYFYEEANFEVKIVLENVYPLYVKVEA